MAFYLRTPSNSNFWNTWKYFESNLRMVWTIHPSCRPIFKASICWNLLADFDHDTQLSNHLIQLRKKFNYNFTQVSSSDETTVFLNIPRNYAVNVKGPTDVKMIMSASYKKQRVPVILRITAFLPPHFKPQNSSQKYIFPKDVRRLTLQEL